MLPILVALHTSRVAVASPSDPVNVAANKMRELRVNSVIVVTRNKIQGILTYFSFLPGFAILQLVLGTLAANDVFKMRSSIFFSFLSFFLCLSCMFSVSMLLCCSSKDILMRVVAHNLSPELTLVEKVCCKSHIYFYFLFWHFAVFFNS